MNSQKILLTLFTLLLFVPLFGQNDDYVSDQPLPRNTDFVYKDNIKSVNFHIDRLFLTYPILDKNRASKLRFSFDDLGDDVKDYTYKIVHCNADWTPSDLTDLEYIDGFSSDIINDYDFSFNTLTKFTHYWLELPNQNVQFTKTGNYLLHIYEGDEEGDLVITRRFMVMENTAFKVVGRVTNPVSVKLTRTHQEIDFVINHQNVRIANPMNEIKVTILQNGRWDNAIKNVKPLFIRNEQLSFDYQNQITFPGNKEFRHVSLKSLRYRTDRVKRLLEDPVDKFHVQLYKDESRKYQSYGFTSDINGNFVIENDHEEDNNLQADYAWVHFYFEAPYEREDGNVYLFGKMTDWNITNKYKMKYDYKEQAYYLKLRLKQGFYNYNYAFVKGAGAKPDIGELDDNWFETENNYTILVYYRPFGSRYDQLVAVQHLNTMDGR